MSYLFGLCYFSVKFWHKNLFFLILCLRSERAFTKFMHSRERNVACTSGIMTAYTAMNPTNLHGDKGKMNEKKTIKTIKNKNE